MSRFFMVFSGRIRESAAATKTFGSLRIDRRVLSTPTRTIAIANIATVSTGTHVTHRPVAVYWLLALLFVLMALGSMRPDFTWGPLTPTGGTVLLGFLTIVFAALALRPDDKTHYLLISSADGVLSRFSAPDRSILEEVRTILTEKINRGDEAMVFNINFDRGHIENIGGGNYPAALPPPSSDQVPQHAGQPSRPGSIGVPDRGPPPAINRPRQNPSEITGPPSRPLHRGQSTMPASSNGATAVKSAPAESFVDYGGVLSAIVEMHRFYARQSGTQHLEQRLSELELLMRAGTPTISQKTRLRELSGEMSQILGAYPQAVELFDHITSLV
jgi:hypothetical protein